MKSPVLPHCLHTTDSDNPDRGIGPSGIICFSILDACSTWRCPFVAYRIRIDGTAQRQCKIMPETLARCKRIYPLWTETLSDKKVQRGKEILSNFTKIKYMTKPTDYRISVNIKEQIFNNLTDLSSINSNNHQVTDNADNTVMRAID